MPIFTSSKCDPLAPLETRTVIVPGLSPMWTTPEAASTSQPSRAAPVSTIENRGVAVAGIASAVTVTSFRVHFPFPAGFGGEAGIVAGDAVAFRNAGGPL